MELGLSFAHGNAFNRLMPKPREASRIIVASCSHQLLPQPLWPIIEGRDAAAFVWAGDAIYSGTSYRILTYSTTYCTGSSILYIVRYLRQSDCLSNISTYLPVLTSYDGHDGTRSFPTPVYVCTLCCCCQSCSAVLATLTSTFLALDDERRREKNLLGSAHR